MGKLSSRIALVCALGVVLLFWPGRSPARDHSRRPAAFRPAQGQEVVSGTYYCAGSTFTDGQPSDISVGSYLGATSGITSGFASPHRSIHVPADLDQMAAHCSAHISDVHAQIPSICTLGEIEHHRGEFGNGASVGSEFAFSCQGTRDEVIGVIGELGRLALSARLD